MFSKSEYFFEWLKKSYMKDQYVQLMKDISKYDKKIRKLLFDVYFMENLIIYLIIKGKMETKLILKYVK